MFLFLFRWPGILFDLFMLLSLHNKGILIHTHAHTHTCPLSYPGAQTPYAHVPRLVDSLTPPNVHHPPLGHKAVVFMLALT